MFVNPENVRNVRIAIEGGASDVPIFPTVYALDPASLCNISCVMCPNPKMPSSDKGFIDVNLFKKIIDDISPYCEFLMLYWMGESLLHPCIDDLLTYARRRIGGRIVLSSNFTKVSDSTIAALLKSCDIVLCSLDRWDPKAYEKIRRGASFAEVVKNIERLSEGRDSLSRCEIVVKALDHDKYSPEYQEFFNFWSSRGVRPLLAWLNDWAGTFPGMRNAAALPIPRTRQTRVPCADLWFKMILNWRGEVCICCFDWRFQHVVGKAHDGDWLREIWNGSEIAKLRQMHLSGDYGSHALCAGCNSWAEPAEHDAYIDWREESYFIVF